jgi:riboflavin synthase
MFTGIVEEKGAIDSVTDHVDALRIRIIAPTVVSDATHGASISVNGICLTVADHGEGWFEADVMRETLERTSLRSLSDGDSVNLERAARVDGRLGGHIVQGHVDGVGVIAYVRPEERWTIISIGVPRELTRYIVEKGSITVDGVSLTVVSVDDGSFTVSLIPTTLTDTTLGMRNVGDVVNIEVDVLAKYVEKLVAR